MELTEMQVPEVNLKWERLLSILQVARPHGTDSERNFAVEILAEYDPSVLVANDGEVLAYVVDVGDDTKTLFSCHVDTVDRREYKKELIIVGDIVKTTDKSDCLGADDGAGMWLLLEMIDAGVPGCYVFHRGEEKGGIGSRGIAAAHTAFLAGFNRAIAFDRRGTSSVITHQFMGRCCSDEFADALTEKLNATIDETYFFAPDDSGTFTDTANYTDDIGECTNISIGYASEHCAKESLDYTFLFALRDACIAMDWESLPSHRRPGEYDPLGWDASYTRYFSPQQTMTQAEWDKEFAYYKDKWTEPLPADLADLSYSSLYAWVETSDPEDVAEVLYNLLHRQELQ